MGLIFFNIIRKNETTKRIMFASLTVHALIVVASLVKVTWGQVTSGCNCERDNLPEGIIGTAVPLLQWSPCSFSHDSPRPHGCYSGTQRRRMKCEYKIREGRTGLQEEVNSLNSDSHHCFETQTCQILLSACTGNWGQWNPSGKCDCKTKKQLQSRYCNQMTDNNTEILSIHCAKSEGRYDQNRHIPCTAQDCAEERIIPPTFTTTTLASTTPTVATTTTNSTFPEGTKEDGLPLDLTENEEPPVSMETLIIGVAVGGVAIIVLLLLIVILLVRRRPEKKMENNNYSHSTLPLPETPEYDNAGHRDVQNTLYVPSSEAVGSYQIPDLSAPHNEAGRRPATTRPPQNPNRHPIPDMRNRSVTVGVPKGMGQYDMANRFNGPDLVTSDAYERPIDNNRESGIYWSIDDAYSTADNPENT